MTSPNILPIEEHILFYIQNKQNRTAEEVETHTLTHNNTFSFSQEIYKRLDFIRSGYIFDFSFVTEMFFFSTAFLLCLCCPKPFSVNGLFVKTQKKKIVSLCFFDSNFYRGVNRGEGKERQEQLSCCVFFYYFVFYI